MRRGQVTLFIILGLVLLLTVVIGMAIYKDWLTFRPPEEHVIKEPITELKPLVFAIERCQDRLLDEGTRLLLAQGGYIDPADAGIVVAPLPAGTGVEMGGGPVPYWSYVQGNSRKSKQPDLIGTESLSIANQLAVYVDERLESCVPWDEFSQYSIGRGTPESMVSFAPGITRISSYWDLSVETAVGTTEFKVFDAEIQAPVMEIYSLAEDVIRQWESTLQPEQLTLEWLAIYASGDSALPPLHGGMDASASIRIWLLDPAREELLEVATRLAESLEVVGSKDWQIALTGDERITQLLDQGMIGSRVPVDEISFSALVPWSSGAHLTIDGNRAVAVPDLPPMPSITRLISPPIQDYRFDFDITYPLVMRVEQDGYALQAAYEVNIDNSRPLRAEPQDEQSDAFCDIPGGAHLIVRTVPQAEASFLYTCGEITCLIGNSQTGSYEGRLPACSSGTLEAITEDAVSEQVTLGSVDGASHDIRMPLFTEREVEIVLKERFVHQTVDGFALSTAAYPSGSQAFLIRHGRPLVVRATGGMVSLLPGRYDVYMINVEDFDPPIVIPEKTECHDTNPLNPFGGTECYTLNSTNFTSLPTTYLDLSEERAVDIPQIPRRIVITAVGLDPNDLQDWDDVELIGALFEEADSLTPEQAVEFEN